MLFILFRTGFTRRQVRCLTDTRPAVAWFVRLLRRDQAGTAYVEVEALTGTNDRPPLANAIQRPPEDVTPPAPPKPKPAVAPTPTPTPPVAAAPASRPEPAPQPTGSGFYLQMGAFAEVANAEELRRRLDAHQLASLILPPANGGAGLYRVRVGPVASREAADQLVRRLTDQGLPKGHVVAD